MTPEDNKCKGGADTPLLFANTKRHLSDGMRQNYTYIPIDYIKWEVIGIDPNVFLNNQSLTFTPELKDGDVLHKYSTTIDGMKMQIMEESKRTTISGSIHKYWNGGKHNHNDFDENSFNQAMQMLLELFGVSNNHLKVIALEYGVNLTTEHPVRLILDHCLQHKSKDIESKISNVRGKFHQAEHDRYILKLYNKGLQYKLSENLFRVEIKSLNWTTHRKNGVFTMEDYIQCDKRTFVENLVNQWMDVIFYDFNSKTYSDSSNFSNANYWRELRRKVQTKEISRTTFHRHWTRLRQNNAIQGIDLQRKIAESIIEKIDALQCGTNSTFSNPSVDFFKRLCPITGVEISKQRQGSFLLSHATLYKLKREQPQSFVEVRNRFLSGKWIDQPESVQIREIAHNIRNTYFNSLARIKRLDDSGQMRLDVV